MASKSRPRASQNQVVVPGRSRGARRRRRRALMGLNQPVSVSRGLLNSGAAPVSQNVIVANTGPRFRSVPGGVIVSHSQKLGSVKGSTSGEAFKFPFNPREFGWIGDVAEHFQHFRVHALSFRYVGRVSTGSGGTCVMAPYYEASPPLAFDAGPNGFLDFLRDLPGVREFAVWASDAVGAAVSNFTRTVFRTIGVLAARPRAGDGAPFYSEAENPGYILGMVIDDSGGASPGRNSGELWVDYSIELSAARGKTASFWSAVSASTDDADLGLDTASYIGEPSFAAGSGTNTITILKGGLATLIIRRTGTNPVEASASIVVNDYTGEDVTTDRVIDSIASSILSQNATVANQALVVGSATVYITIGFFRFRHGDQLVIPASYRDWETDRKSTRLNSSHRL